MEHTITGQTVAYVRVSSADQDTARQEDALAPYHPEKTFTDHCSGKDTERPGLESCLGYIREGDTLIVASIDRLCRNVTDLLNILGTLKAKGIRVRFLKEGLDTGDNGPMANMLITIIGAISEFERSLIRERQAEGFAAVRKRGGKLGGRPPVLNTAQKEEFIRLRKLGIPTRTLAAQYGVSLSYAYRLVKGIQPDQHSLQELVKTTRT